MMKIRKNNFTMIELLAVIAIIGIIISTATPSFNRMIMGSAVNQAANQIRTTLQRARAEAAVSRKYVAVVFGLPSNLNGFELPENYYFRSYRLAHIEKDGNFLGWISDWELLPDETALIYWNANRFSSRNKGNAFTSVSAARSNAALGTANFPGVLAVIKNATNNYNKSEKKFTTTSTQVGSTRTAVVFNPYGGVETQLTLGVAEANYVGSNKFVYKTADSNGHPANHVLMFLNQFTGSVNFL